MTQYAPLKEQLNNWNLQHDNQCFLTIQNFSGSLMNKANEIFHSFQDTEYNINNYASVINNHFSKFVNISNTKFTENKLEDAKIDDNNFKFDSKVSKIAQEPPQQPETDQVIKQRFKTAIETSLFTCNLDPYIDQSDSNDENLSSTGSSDERLSQFSSMLTAKGNNFPAIIGSQTFMNDEFIGIKIEDQVQPQIQQQKIQIEPVQTNQNIVPGNIQMVQSNLPVPPQFQATQYIPAAPTQQIPQPPQQQSIPQPPPLFPQANQLQSSNIPIAPQLVQTIQPPKAPASQPQINIVASSSAPPPPVLNLMPKPPALPGLPKIVKKEEKKVESTQQKQQQPSQKSEMSIQDAFQQKLREMQEKKQKSSQIE